VLQVTILNCPEPASEGISRGLSYPVPFAAVDAMMAGDDGRLKYHYAVIDVRGPCCCCCCCCCCCW
jgi:hypothetical protein